MCYRALKIIIKYLNLLILYKPVTRYKMEENKAKELNK